MNHLNSTEHDLPEPEKLGTFKKLDENDEEINYNQPKLSPKSSPKSKTKEIKIKREKDRGIVYGVELEKVEKDLEHINVPRFVVVCIAIIEEEENITTNGIYRASGNKNSIELVKKKMNEKRENKYCILEKQDLHTLTGVLKMFFRELKSELIPNEIFEISKSTGNCNFFFEI